MSRFSLLQGCSLLCLATFLAIPSMAAEPLSPRVEVGVKGGTDRSLLTTEFWAPLAQKSDRVLYGDIRLMGDNDENREGNLGLGYRQIVDDAVLGVHGWIDRRRTQNNSTFHQVTLGVERLGHIIDARANMYVPLNQSRNINTPNIGQASPYLAGSGIFYDTNGLLQETPQYGVDGEVGYRIPVFQKHADAIRVYGGGYHFFRDETQDVTGFRVRTEAQINSAFSVGARFQHDGPRGSQGFLEATIKFPFGAKKLYQTDYLRARLDESPERDVDIVTAARQIDNGLMKPVLNATSGEQQRILYVDNSNAQSGDGTKDNPFNTLKAAEAALKDNDILYVNHGTGTSAGMDQGIIIDKANIQLVGSGSALTYGGFTLLNAGLAPVISNNDAFVEDATNRVFAGNSIFLTAKDFSLTGVSLMNAQGFGVYSDVIGTDMGDITISNITISGNQRGGMLFYLNDGSALGKLSISDAQVSNNVGSLGLMLRARNNVRVEEISLSNIDMDRNFTGVQLNANTDSLINKITANNVTVTNTVSGIGFNIISQFNSDINQVDLNALKVTDGNDIGLRVATASTGRINALTLSNSEFSGNNEGFRLQNHSGGLSQNFVLTNLTVNNNRSHGIYLYNLNDGSIVQNLSMDGINANGNTGNGIYLQSNLSISSNISVSNTVTNDNQASGILVYALASGTANNVYLTGITADENNVSGIRVISNSGTLSNVYLSDVSAKNNQENGVYFNSQTATSILSASVDNSVFTGNNLHGAYVFKNVAAAVLNLDMGGGHLNSVGNNTIYGNVDNDVRLNLVGGGNVMARNNYWGGGNLTRLTTNSVTLSTIDTANFLTTDPNSSL